MPKKTTTISNLKKMKSADTIWIDQKKISLNSSLSELDKSFPTNLKFQDLVKNQETPNFNKGFDNPLVHNYKYKKIPAEKLKSWEGSFPTIPSFIFSNFGKIISEKLDDKMMGYCIRVSKFGVPLATYSFNKAQTIKNSENDWSSSTRMHIASCSKFITAVALVKLLKEKNISYDARIADFLPMYWNLHDDVLSVNGRGITFRDIFTHKSGLSPCRNEENTYLTMQSIMSKCVRYNGCYRYENINFELMRIMISIISEKISRYSLSQSVFQGIRDGLWNFLTIHYYREYVLEHIFKPSGVKYAIFNSDLSKVSGYPFELLNKKAFAYNSYNSTENGWDSGNLSSGAGTVGWRLTVRELSKILSTVRRIDKIISSKILDEIFENQFGIHKGNSYKGDYFFHNGWWQNGDKQVEQAVQFFFPEEVEIVALGNSFLNFNVQKQETGSSFENEIFDAYQKSLGIGK